MNDQSRDAPLPAQSRANDEIDDLCDRFHAAWKAGERLQIEEYLKQVSPADAAARRDLLFELIKTDIECRWRYPHASNATAECSSSATPSDESTLPARPRLEDYVQCHRQLGPLDQLPLSLIAWEYEVRHHWGDRPGHPEYTERFPGRQAEVEQALQETDRERLAGTTNGTSPLGPPFDSPPQPGVLRVCCPHCHNRIEIVDSGLASQVACPDCGSSFGLVSDSAAEQDADGETDNRTPRTVGRFELLEKVGTGAFGSVWRGRDTRLDRPVAVKIPRRGDSAGRDAEQFLREARAAAQLHHPHIVTVHEVGPDEGTVYIVSDFVEGVSLDKRLADWRPTAKEAAELCVKVAGALHHAHEHGVIHRDLKPANIMIDAEGEPFVMDFGLAKREAGEVTMTLDGQILGTPAYMSPEQAQGAAHEADRRSDVYSLGVILFELLTGGHPFRGSMRMLLKQIVEDDPPAPRKLDSAIPRDLETICLKCLEKAPDRRYATADAVAEELQRFVDGQPIKARPISRAERAWRWCKRNRVVASLTAAVILVLLAGTAATTYYAIQSARRADEAQTNLSLAEQNEADARREAARANTEANRANEETRRATDAEALATEQRDRAEAESEAARRESYFNTIALAHREWRDGDVMRAAELLRKCPSDLRQWEWFLLESLCDLNERVVPVGDHPAKPRAMAFDPQGTLLVCACRGEIHAVDSKKWHPLWNRGAHDQLVYSIAFHPEGDLLATSGDDGKLCLWNVVDGEPMGELTGHAEEIRAVAFDPRTQEIIGIGSDAIAYRWDLSSRDLTGEVCLETDMEYVDFEFKFELSGSHSGCRLPKIAPDGRRVLLSQLHRVQIWDLATGEAIWKRNLGNFDSGAWSPDGEKVALRRGDRSELCLRDAETGELQTEIPVTSFPSLDISFASNARFLAGADSERGVQVLDFDANRLRWSFRMDGPRKARFSPDGRCLAAAVGRNIHVLDLPAEQEATVTRLRKGGCPNAHICLDRSLALLAGPSSVFDLATDSPILRIPGSTGKVAWSQNGRRMAVALNDRIVVYDLPSGRCIHEFKSPGDYVCDLALSSDGNLVALGAYGHQPVVRETSGSGEPRIVSDGNRWEVQQLAFSSDGRHLVVGGTRDEPTMPVFDTGSWSKVLTLTGHRRYSNVVAMVYNIDGSWLVTGGDRRDRLVKLWDMTTGEELKSFRGHDGIIRAVALSPDDRRLASGSDDGTVRIWDVPTGRELLRLPVSDGVPAALDFTPDGLSLVAITSTGYKYAWGVHGNAVPPGERVDLIELIDPESDAVQGNWTRECGELKIERARRHDRFAVPVRPFGSYRIRAELTRIRSGRCRTVGLVLPIGSRQTMLCLDHEDRRTSGLGLVDGVGAGDPNNPHNPTNVFPGAIEDGRRYSVEIEVLLKSEDAAIAVTLDGAPYLSWRGRQTSLNMASVWDIGRPGCFGLAVGDVDVVFHSLELEMLDGRARLLRSSPKTEAPARIPGVAPVPAGQAVDLIEQLRGDQVLFDATVEAADDGIRLQNKGDGFGKMMLPAWPRGSYEVSGAFTLMTDAEFVLLLPTMRTRGLIHWRVKGCSGLAKIQDIPPWEEANPTRVEPSRVTVGQRHAFRIRVVLADETAEVQVELDGALYMEWKGPESDLRHGEGWDLPNQRVLGAGVNNGTVKIHELKFKSLDGEAWLLEP